MRSAGWLLSAAVMSQCFAGAALAHGVKTRTLELIHPYVVETKAGDTTAGVFLTIESRSRMGDRLTGATSPMATSVELHEPEPAGTAEGSRRIASIAIGPKGRVDLKRSGPHLRLIGITKPFAPWETFPLTLIFERAGRIEVEVLVEEDLGPAPAR